MYVKYHECGYSVIPVDGKKPILPSWSTWCKTEQSEKLIEGYQEKYPVPEFNIGVCCGEASGIMALDIDTDDKEILGSAQQSNVIKRGKKGETRFFQYNKTIKTQSFYLVDILSDGRMTVIPPSKHPETNKPYEWLTDETLEDVGRKGEPRDLPKLDLVRLEELKSACARLKEKTLGIADCKPIGRNDTIKAMACCALTRNRKDVSTVAREIYHYDSNNYTKKRLFMAAKGEQWAGKNEEDAKANAKKFVENIRQSLIKDGKIPALGWTDDITIDVEQLTSKEVIVREELIPLYENKTPQFPTPESNKWLFNFTHQVSREVEVPIDMSFLFALAALSTSASRINSFRIKDNYYEPLNVWICVALESGNRKSAAMSKCLDPLLEWGKSEDERLKDEIIKAKSRRASEEKIIEGLRSSLKKTPLEKQEFIIQKIIKLEQFLTEIPRVIDLFTSDITQEKLGVALMDNFERFAFISDEGGVFDSMKGRYNTQGLVNMDLFLKAHAGTADRVLRMDRSVYLEKPALTFCVSPQPSVLADLSKTKEFRGKGLTARFLFSVPKSLVGERTGGQPMEESVRLAYRDNIFKLLNKRPVKIDGVIQSNELNMTEEARELWQSFSNDIESNLGKGGELEELKDWGSKLPGATARIAGLLHLAMHVDADEPWKILVSKDTMFESILIAEYLIPHAKAAFGIISEDPDITKAKKILEWMRDLGSNQFTQRQCHNALQRTFPRVVDLQKILNILLERSYITELKNRKATPRASKVFEINPAALSST